MKPPRSLFELSRPGRGSWTLPRLDVPPVEPEDAFGSQARADSDMPELSEVDIARHYIGLSVLNHHVDRGFYPLGSCTMKYNPKVNERAARLSGFADLHPLAPDEACQGALRLMYELGGYLKEITGMDAVTLQPAAGAHGELCGMMMIRQYLEKRGEAGRVEVLVPDSAHGTNPASVTLSGFRAVEIKSNERGELDPAELERRCTDCVACLMVTNPNTLGIFESRAREICDIMHRKGALVYLDGANLNSYLGIHRPGDAGFDVMHINLHKTFSTPHGGGGPGAGPVVAKSHLEPFLPRPVVKKNGDGYSLDGDRPDSIGRLLSSNGQFGVMVRAWTYIRMLGAAGLRQVAEDAVLNANYVRAGLEGVYDLPYPGRSLHEVVFSGANLKRYGIRTLDVAKRLLDFGLHAPTIYFPLIVPEALMIEPTETESLEALDEFVAVMKLIAEEAASDPDVLRQAPTRTPVRRLDDAKASRQLNVSYRPAAGGPESSDRGPGTGDGSGEDR
ncbi:MAG: aminomethyl-transferring glycine dehydrogenase subunit GcvPB [bacterium]